MTKRKTEWIIPMDSLVLGKCLSLSQFPVSKISYSKTETEVFAFIKISDSGCNLLMYKEMWGIEMRETTNENDTNTRPSITIRPIFVTPCAFHFSKCVVNVVCSLSQMPLCKYVNRICAQHFANWRINDRKCCTFIDYLY